MYTGRSAHPDVFERSFRLSSGCEADKGDWQRRLPRLAADEFEEAALVTLPA